MSQRRIGIVSDSHGCVYNIECMVKKAPEVVCWIHAGDYCEDAEILAAYAGVPVYSVRGNNDLYAYQKPDCRDVAVDGVIITVIHGHQWYDNRLKKLIELGKNHQASLVVFGHTHCQMLEKREKILIVNPGSISLPRDGKTGT
ncbi:MAG: YfcE family phosphodiesterase, partial [Megasphaera sp.]|nr:YfcE family phosphodiesterase [Megasphaera sp.]